VARLQTQMVLINGQMSTVTHHIHDHYEYRVEKHLDGEDFIIQIANYVGEKEKYVTRYVYVTQDVYSYYQEGDWFRADFKERDSRRDSNNTVVGITPWSRHQQDIRQY